MKAVGVYVSMCVRNDEINMRKRDYVWGSVFPPKVRIYHVNYRKRIPSTQSYAISLIPKNRCRFYFGEAFIACKSDLET